jgi:PAS domain S-box-containing protein
MEGKPRFITVRWAVAAVFFATLVVMSVFELAKQVIRPDITIWESHEATILFTSVISIAIAYLPIRALQGAQRRMSEEAERRKSVEDQLRTSEAQYRSFIESTEDSVYTVDLKGRYLMVNPRHLTRSRRLSDDCTGKSYGEFHTPDETQRFTMLIRRVIGTRAPVRDEFERDGRTFLRRLNPVLDSLTGEITAVTVVSREITEWKRAEKAMIEANRKLNLMSDVTRHDVLNQLLVLGGYLDLVNGNVSDPKIAEYVSKCQDAVKTIRNQISFTRDYQNIGVHAPEWQNVRSIIARAQQSFLFAGFTENPACDALEVYADPLLEKVFYNLVDNALRYGGSITTIGFSCSREGDNLIIACVDDGVGVSPDMKEQIFTRGFGKNTGFGLFLVREILGITGMTIQETGKEGEGARFEITVPKDSFRFIHQSALGMTDR